MNLPIEPKWNWNVPKITPIFYRLNFQSNQSGIETKTTYILSLLCGLPIEPKWNWNFVNIYINGSARPSNRTKVELKHHFTIILLWGFRLPIEPKWNWNTTSTGNADEWQELPIEPKWNWNWPPGKAAKRADWASNRTKVELKLNCAIVVI